MKTSVVVRAPDQKQEDKALESHEYLVEGVQRQDSGN